MGVTAGVALDVTGVGDTASLGDSEGRSDISRVAGLGRYVTVRLAVEAVGVPTTAEMIIEDLEQPRGLLVSIIRCATKLKELLVMEPEALVV